MQTKTDLEKSQDLSFLITIFEEMNKKLNKVIKNNKEIKANIKKRSSN